MYACHYNDYASICVVRDDSKRSSVHRRRKTGNFRFPRRLLEKIRRVKRRRSQVTSSANYAGTFPPDDYRAIYYTRVTRIRLDVFARYAPRAKYAPFAPAGLVDGVRLSLRYFAKPSPGENATTIHGFSITAVSFVPRRGRVRFPGARNYGKSARCFFRPKEAPETPIRLLPCRMAEYKPTNQPFPYIYIADTSSGLLCRTIVSVTNERLAARAIIRYHEAPWNRWSKTGTGVTNILRARDRANGVALTNRSGGRDPWTIHAEYEGRWTYDVKSVVVIHDATIRRTLRSLVDVSDVRNTATITVYRNRVSVKTDGLRVATTKYREYKNAMFGVPVRRVRERYHGRRAPSRFPKNRRRRATV